MSKVDHKLGFHFTGIVMTANVLIIYIQVIIGWLGNFELILETSLYYLSVQIIYYL